VLVLYQFPFSHYCEKTRWQLDAKGLSWVPRDMPPGSHRLVAARYQTANTVPLLVDGSVAVGDSAAIGRYLEAAYPERPLVSAAPDERAKSYAIEAEFDEGLGRDVRLWIYGTLALERGATSIWARYYSGWSRALVVLTRPILEPVVRRKYRMRPDSVATASQRLDEQIDALERMIEASASGYLVGKQLSVADIAAASLLAPLVVPAGSPWERLDDMPAEIEERRERICERPAGRWVLERYRHDRQARLG
jgi:glutathione S-transferase